MASPRSQAAHSDSPGHAGPRDEPPLFAPPSTATTPSAAAAAELYPDIDYDMLDDDDDQLAAAAPGPGPSTLANRGHKRTASPPPQHTAKKHKPRQSATTTTLSGGRYDPPPLPHYTVVRSSQNSKQSPHRIIINHGVTDAHPDRWPPKEEYSPTRKIDGKENWYERTPKDSGRHKAFRDKVGEELAKTLNSSQRPNEFWTLDALPDNYLFTVHHTMGGGKPRTDVYVWGSSKVLKFRTANEMTPHIHWLLVHGPNDAIACQCKYCAKMTQSDVNRQLGLPLKQTGAAGGGGSSSSSPARGSSPASMMGPRVKNPVNYRPSPLALAGGSGPPSTSSSSGYGYGANAARVASFNDPGGDRLLGPNATPAAIAKAKRRHAKEMEKVGGRKKNQGEGKGKEREKEKKKKEKKKKSKGLLPGGAGIGSAESDDYGGDSSDLSDLGDTTDRDDDDDDDADVGGIGAGYSGGDGGEEYGPSYRGAFTNRMRDEDLERAAAPRRGELVWAELPRPLYGVKGGRLEGKVVTHWPGIVEGREIRNEAVVVQVAGDEDDAADAGKGKVAAVEGERGVETEEGNVENATTTTTTAAAAAAAVAIPARPGTTFCLAPPPRLKTIPSTRYSVRLLAVADTIRHLREDQAVPWIGHAGPVSLFEGFDEVLQDREAVKHIWDGKGFVRDTLLFDDDDGDGGEPEKESQGQDAGSRAAAAVGAPKTLDEALIPLGLAMQIASELMATFTLNDRYNVTARFFTPVDPTDPVHLQEREKQLRSWAFQSTHFGAELVWTGDFVRLFETEGTAFEGIKYDSPPTSVGQRALFMKVFAIYKVNSGVDEPGLIKLAGELWELRDFASTSTMTTTMTTAPTIAQAGDGNAAPHTSGSGAELTVAGDAVTAADGQSAMSMFEKRPSPVRVNGPAPSSTLAVIAGTPSTPPDTPPARGGAAPAAAAAAIGAGEEGRNGEAGPARDGAAAAAAVKASPASTFDPEALNLPPPPAGYYWFRLTTPAEQVHVSIDFLAGRYHPLPKELNSPAKIRETFERLQHTDEAQAPVDDDARAVLLAGLGPAYKLFNKCGLFIGDRRTALVRATLAAEKEARPRLQGMAAAAVAPVQDDFVEEGPAPTAGTA